jgi:hypothetical protein
MNHLKEESETSEYGVTKEYSARSVPDAPCNTS